MTASPNSTRPPPYHNSVFLYTGQGLSVYPASETQRDADARGSIREKAKLVATSQRTIAPQKRRLMADMTVTDIVIAAATVVLVGITWRYVRLTGSLLKATYKPQLFISLRYKEFIGSSGHSLHWQHIYVKNIEVGLARKVEFGGDLSFKTGKSTPLTENGLIKNGIDALAPGQEMNDSVEIDFEPDEAYPTVLITVTYKDSMGGDYDDEFTLDFNDRSSPIESGSS